MDRRRFLQGLFAGGVVLASPAGLVNRAGGDARLLTVRYELVPVQLAPELSDPVCLPVASESRIFAFQQSVEPGEEELTIELVAARGTAARLHYVASGTPHGHVVIGYAPGMRPFDVGEFAHDLMPVDWPIITAERPLELKVRSLTDHDEQLQLALWYEAFLA